MVGVRTGDARSAPTSKLRKVIGIDLGTSKCVVAVMRGTRPEVVPNADGSACTPSVVAWSPSGAMLVGRAAKQEVVLNASNTVFSTQRLLGQRFEETRDTARWLPFGVVPSEGGEARLDIAGRALAVSDVSAIVLKALKESAEWCLNEPVTDAVVTVPAHFDLHQRAAIRRACALAGLNARWIIGHANAAALAYGFRCTSEGLIAVYDFGGGTFDVSIVEVSENLVEVRSTNGDMRLGGDDVDHRVMEYLMAEFRKEHGVDLAKDKMALQRIRDASEKAKIELSSMQETTVNLPYITAAGATPLHMNIRVTRSKLEQMIEDLVERSLEACRRALKDADKRPGDINEVVLVGGSTRIPLVLKKVKEYFGKEPNRSVNPDEVVAIGAAVQGAILTGEVKDMLLLDVTPLSLGVETKGGIFTALIPRNTTIPTSKSEIFSTASDNQTQVEVHVLQGERPMARDNKSLGRFELKGIPAAPQGVPKIKVSFDIDANGILQVSAKDEATGTSHKITITAGSGLAKDEVERMVREAQSHEAEDKRRRDEAEDRNKLDALTYQVEKTLRDHKDKIPAEDASTLDGAVREARSAIERQDGAAVKAALDKLQTESHRIASMLYQQTGQEGGDAPPTASGGAAAPAGEKKRDDVIDAEFEENK
jgi:molecular chaperone DnaK